MVFSETVNRKEIQRLHQLSVENASKPASRSYIILRKTPLGAFCNLSPPTTHPRTLPQAPRNTAHKLPSLELQHPIPLSRGVQQTTILPLPATFSPTQRQSRFSIRAKPDLPESQTTPSSRKRRGDTSDTFTSRADPKHTHHILNPNQEPSKNQRHTGWSLCPSALTSYLATYPFRLI
ncbi:uncharacterized protein BDW43DRAFT_30728 [Aspergillus alliaceus]|uniref:uncharacterized protein n=1 Tax=Petromyces alliaceus TaxID=209559 RepID=UPI0012A3F885|nr:uncharacterized protein BDW43DRAFT_30728 [Aspergillus alliaceus]KAB8235339.1 hypothetical protein BDW43DRAFT_30728 [Aspergillus alliaceus]